MRLAEHIDAEHRRIAEALDRLIEALRGGDPEAALEWSRAAWGLAEIHFEAEERILFPAVRAGFRRTVAKMEDQHAQVREAAAALEEAAGSGAADFFPIGRRFHALLEHHLIEEERGLVALVGRFLEAPLERELVEAFRRSAQNNPGRSR